MAQRNEIKDVKDVELINLYIKKSPLGKVSNEELDYILKTRKRLENCDLSENNISFKDLSGFEFENVIFPRDFEFKNFNFEGAKFRYVDFGNSRFKNCSFEFANFEYVACSGMFRNCNLTYNSWRCCDLGTINFEKSDLTMADFDNVNLSEAVFGKANLECVSFRGCVVEKAVSYKTDFTGSVFQNTSLRDSVLSKSDYDDASFINVDVKDARFVKCDFSRVFSIDKDCNFEKAKLEGSNLLINSEKDITVEE